MRKTAGDQNNDLVVMADVFWLLATLRARKGDVDRAVALTTNFLQRRQNVKYEENSQSTTESSQAVLDSGILLSAGNVSQDGRHVLTIRYRYFHPR